MSSAFGLFSPIFRSSGLVRRIWNAIVDFFTKVEKLGIPFFLILWRDFRRAFVDFDCDLLGST
jgi:hypothetical protein